MEITQSKSGEVLEMALSGRLDAIWSNHLEESISEVVNAGERRIRLNMADVVYISSAGIRVLLKWYKALRRLNGSLTLVRLTEDVGKLLSSVGLLDALTEEPEQNLAASDKLEKPSPSDVKYGPVVLKVYGQDCGATLQCRELGDPGWIGKPGLGAEDLGECRLSPDVLALGLGAFGHRFEDCRERLGEFLGVGGVAVHLPTDRTASVPDYLLAAESFIPTAHVLHGLQVQGKLSRFIQFSPKEESAVTLSQLARMAMDITGGDKVAMAFAAETSGLVGAALKRSPALAQSPEDFFSFPQIRSRLTFTPDKAYSGRLALVVGVAVAGEGETIASSLRPLDTTREVCGHFHAVIFPGQALPRGELQLEKTVAGLFKRHEPLGVLHLLNDTRELGAGESQFVRGAIWTGAIERIGR